MNLTFYWCIYPYVFLPSVGETMYLSSLFIIPIDTKFLR